MSGELFAVHWSEAAKDALKAIGDRRIMLKIIERGDALAIEPEKQGKHLGEELSGFQSVRAVGQRYRIVYRVERDKRTVQIPIVGIRRQGDKRDVYELARRMVRLGLA